MRNVHRKVVIVGTVLLLAVACGGKGGDDRGDDPGAGEVEDRASSLKSFKDLLRSRGGAPDAIQSRFSQPSQHPDQTSESLPFGAKRPAGLN